MPLGREERLSPGDIVLAPNFRLMSIVTKLSPISGTAELLFLVAEVGTAPVRA